MSGKDFYTFSEYMKKEDNLLTASMEDYLEMICRLSSDTGFTRIHDLSSALNVQPPSATKMVQRLSAKKLLKYEKYGVIMLEEKGKAIGAALLKRHTSIENLLRMLGVGESEILEETEKIEHTIHKDTLKCFENFLSFIEENPDVYDKLKGYIKLKQDINENED
ncbi:MAG: iron dependent repressor, metal binding and dimerization domain protein [Bacillota bacterium]|nr:iron dependent repressor, metal binding and dimerization domain protein [Bacillota bacterium]